MPLGVPKKMEPSLKWQQNHVLLLNQGNDYELVKEREKVSLCVKSTLTLTLMWFPSYLNNTVTALKLNPTHSVRAIKEGQCLA